MAVLETIQKTQIMEYPALAKLGKEANDEMFSKMNYIICCKKTRTN